LRRDVQDFLDEKRQEFSEKLEAAISKIENILEEVRKASPRASENFKEERLALGSLALGSEKAYKSLKAKVKKLQSADPPAFWGLFWDIKERHEEWGALGKVKSIFPFESSMYNDFCLIFSMIEKKWRAIFEAAREAIGTDKLYGLFLGDMRLKRYVESNLSFEFNELKRFAKELEQCLEKRGKIIFPSDLLYEKARLQIKEIKKLLAPGYYLTPSEVDNILSQSQVIETAYEAKNKANEERKVLGERKFI
jgi:mRNA-degrading endonuclease HigB of HigAB toxin-antitoxin module